MRRSAALLASKAAKDAASRFFLGSKPVGAWLPELAGVLHTHGYAESSVALATSLDPTAPSPALDLASRLAESCFPGFPAVPLGGLGGLPSLGRTGFHLFEERAREVARLDWLFVYGCGVYINADGKVRTDTSAFGKAFEVCDAAGGINGLDDKLFSDKHDAQQARLLLEVARVYETHLVAHPDPEARLAYANFAAVQSSLREVVEWSTIGPGTRFAALGGITVHLEGDDDEAPPPPPNAPESDTLVGNCSRKSSSSCFLQDEPYFLPLAFEMLDPEAGALHDLMDDLSLHKGVKGGRRKAVRSWTAPSLPPRLHKDLLFPLALADEEGE